jgi:hypothetical protein
MSHNLAFVFSTSHNDLGLSPWGFGPTVVRRSVGALKLPISSGRSPAAKRFLECFDDDLKIKSLVMMGLNTFSHPTYPPLQFILISLHSLPSRRKSPLNCDNGV